MLGYSYEHFSRSRAYTTSKSRQVTSKCQGGLGTGSISAKNKALIFKWLWRYGNLDIGIWKIMVSSIYKQKSSFNIPLKMVTSRGNS